MAQKDEKGKESSTPMANEGRKGKRGFYANANEGLMPPAAAAAVVRGPGPLPGRPTGPAGLGPRAPGVLQTD